MRLITKYERREAANQPAQVWFPAELFLHGADAWPDDATAEEMSARRGRAVNVAERAPHYDTVHLLASLRVLAPDELDPQQVARTLKDAQSILRTSPGAWIRHQGIWLRFERNEKITAEEQNSLLDNLTNSAETRLGLRRTRSPLRVEGLVLRNFRAFRRLTLTFSSQPSTVFVGANGSGKSTLLDAVALLLSQFATSMGGPGNQRRRLTDDDIRNDDDTAKIAINAKLGVRDVTWDIGRARGNERSIEPGLHALGDATREAREASKVCVPVVAHYRVNRAVIEIHMKTQPLRWGSPTDAYDGALAGGLPSFDLFFDWFNDREIIERDARIENEDDLDHHLEAIRRALRPFLKDFNEIRVRGTRMFVNKREKMLAVDQLSDGEKCVVAMVGDLARRLAIANPWADDPLLGDGIILIDEIDLHLHPSWQRDVIPKLESTFRNCQFLLTTHSPQVISDVHPESLRLLKEVEGEIVVGQPDQSFGMDSNRILLELMGVDERPHKEKLRLEAIFTLLGDNKLAEATKAIAELAADIGPEPELAKASAMIHRKKIIGR